MSDINERIHRAKNKHFRLMNIWPTHLYVGGSEYHDIHKAAHLEELIVHLRAETGDYVLNGLLVVEVMLEEHFAVGYEI